MKELEISRHLLPLGILLFCVGGSLAATAEPVPTPQLEISCASVSADGGTIDSIAVPVGKETIVVSVFAPDADPKSATLHFGAVKIPSKKSTWDPVSKLLFLSVESTRNLPPQKWKNEVGAGINATLHTREVEGSFDCQSVGWVRQVAGKILPFALMNVNFSRAVPQPGTAIVDDNGAVVGIVFQGSGTGNNGYAIPAEAVHRVKHDLIKNGSLVRGWVGLALRSESAVPQISRILEDSPAAIAGIQVEDVITRIGCRQINDYADASNAFFYLTPGEPVTIGLRRGQTPVEITLTPTGPPADL